jgi:hypothetical protein
MMIGPTSITAFIQRDYYSHYKCVKYYTKVGMFFTALMNTRYLCFSVQPITNGFLAKIENVALSCLFERSLRTT